MFSCCFFVLFNLQSQWKSRGEQRQFLCLPRSAHKARPTALSAEAERRQTSISIHYNREAFISFIKKTKRNETKRRRRRNEGECICVCERIRRNWESSLAAKELSTSLRYFCQRERERAKFAWRTYLWRTYLYLYGCDVEYAIYLFCIPQILRPIVTRRALQTSIHPHPLPLLGKFRLIYATDPHRHPISIYSRNSITRTSIGENFEL